MKDIRRAVVAIAGNANWTEILECLAEMKKEMVERLIDCKDPIEIHRMQGKAQQLNDLIDLFDAGKAEDAIREQGRKIKTNLGGF